ncbi:PEP/pyruvate-binding domain-containing protein [Kitasatospora purpeofusca]|uniref:PEP/pyruvate-binding domain-containing protein n=1 Tax=Kitasatospora purpeofusca TaxID=67352 RepID=UPI002A5A0B5B|nr:PEP/pyruvate-binding domain-containing protein [Kitasatospora purpeofusca]MDY0814371.1 PEP/pyruvate-binding domain-containing protein [Kitasatospora purpeofusca]
MTELVVTTATDGGEVLADAARVGNKFARQEVLRRAGFRIPEFFCLTAAAFDEALDALRPSLPAEPAPGAERAEVESWCAAAREALGGARLPVALAERIRKEFAAVAGPDGLVAVRACVVPAAAGAAEANAAEAAEAIGEDSAVDPFAGMSDSFLYVDEDALEDAVLRCWASAFNPQAVRYRTLRGLDPLRARVAVGIQRMVLGTRSFVAFTRDPRDGAVRRVVAAAYGIGEGVVQEKADIDHFFHDPATDEVTARTVRKQWSMGLPEGAAAGAPVLLPVAGGLADVPVLDDRQVRAVAELAARVEELFGVPQDIEGALTEDGVVHLLQARPLVTAPPTAGQSAGQQAGRPQTAGQTTAQAQTAGPAAGQFATEEPGAARVYWGNHNITESFPGVSGALTFSQSREFYRRSFADLYRRMGVPESWVRDNAHRLARMVGYLEGQVYYRLDDWHALHGQMPMFELVRRGWEQAMGITGPARGERRWAAPAVALALPRLAWRSALHPWQVKSFLRWWDRQMAEAETVGDSPEELIAFYRRLWERAGERWGVTLVNAFIALVVLGAGSVLLRRWTGEGPQVLVGLMGGGRENRSLEAVRAAMGLAELVGAVPELRAAVLDDASDPEQLWRQIVEGHHGAAVGDAARGYVARYGDRALHDLKLEEPTPRQRPWTVLALIRPLVRQGATVAANRADEQAAARKARERLREVLPNPARRAVLLGVTSIARDLARIREDTRFCRTQLFGLSRDVMWRLGAELARTGVLDDALDVADLTVEEVIGAFDGTGTVTDLRALVALRRTQRERWAKNPQRPALLGTPAGLPFARALPGASPVGTAAAADDGLLRGIGSSGGVVRGRAKVVLDPATDPDLAAGRILVARETDPGWLFLMMSATGMVVERGTLLSHTAITGRLLGIPTVVAVPGATTAIADGAWIEIDGTAGTVRLLPPSEQPEEPDVPGSDVSGSDVPGPDVPGSDVPGPADAADGSGPTDGAATTDGTATAEKGDRT